MKKYEMVAQSLKEQIENGVYTDRLPTEAALMATYGVSRVTVRKSIEILQQEVPLRRSKKGGTRIIRPSTDRGSKQFVLLIPDNILKAIDIIAGAEDILSHSSISLTVKYSGLSDKSERALLEELNELDVAGFLIYPANKSANNDLFLNIMKKGIPLVFIDRSPTKLTCSSVSINNQNTAIQIVDYLAEKGHRNIALFANGLRSQQSTLERLWGYLAAMKKHRLPVSKDNIYAFQNDEELCNCLNRFFSQRHLPTAVFCTDDVVAFHFMDEARRRGFLIPQDFSVVGIDNLSPPAGSHFAPLTTIDQPYRELGRRAARIATDMLDSGCNEVAKVYLPAQFIERESVASPSVYSLGFRL